MSTIHDHLLSHDGMRTARSAICACYKWFIHETAFKNLDSIKSKGLTPSDPGGVASDAREVGSFENYVAQKIVCLQPINTNYSHNKNQGRTFKLAVCAQSLPSELSLDWSYGGAWGCATALAADDPLKAAEAIFCEVAARTGSIVVYQPIPPVALRVWVKESSESDPASWVPLNKVSAEMVATIERGLPDDTWPPSPPLV